MALMSGDKTMSWWVGLDLGQAADYTALACIEQSKGSVNQYALRHLERFQIGMPYPKMVNEVGKIITTPPLPGCTLVPDATGVGRAVTDLLLEAKMPARIIPITITAGMKTTSDGRGGYLVHKKSLVAAIKMVLQTQRLHIPASLPLAQVLIRELRTFTLTITDAGNETYGAENDHAHDDLVLAISLALWAAETRSQSRLKSPH
jgi:hypothetical protein